MKDKNKLAVIDGETLMDMRLVPTKFCVDTLLPQGICILGGAPKIGKSWLVLDLCVHIAKGEPIWNLQTHKGTVLYLCLEDTLRHVQERLNSITDEVPKEVYFATTAHTLADGLCDDIRSFVYHTTRSNRPRSHRRYQLHTESAHDEFLFVKERFGKEDGRQYYHVIQSFAPEENVTPELAHEIGMELAMYFGGYQAVVSTHINEAHIHNHIVFNLVNFENGKKFHQSRDDMLKVKEYSNKLCRERGLSVTEEKCTYGRYPKWKKRLCAFLDWALECSPTPEAFIECMERHGYKVKWYSDYKYMTFTTPEGYTCRDNKLFDERFLKSNIELYFAMGGSNGALAETYRSYKTPEHDKDMNMTVTTGLIRMIGDVLSAVPPRESYTPRQLTEMDWEEKERLEEILGRKISPQAFLCYCTQEEYEQANGLGFGMYM